MDARKLRSIQAPLKARLREEPDAARITLKATGRIDDNEIVCKVDTAREVVSAGLHPARPKVTSAVVRIQVYPRPALEVEDTGAFFKVVRAGFSTPRKQLRNSLANGLAVPPERARLLLEEAGIDPRARAETLRLEQWGALYREVDKAGVGDEKVR